MKYVLGTAVVGFFLVLGLTHPWMGWLGSSTAQAKTAEEKPAGRDRGVTGEDQAT